MESIDATQAKPALPSQGGQAWELWRRMPSKGVLLILLAAWVLLFYLFGNSTLGYISTTSIFSWLDYMYRSSPDNEHGFLIPFVVAGLLWWKRKELLTVPKRSWWPALIIVGVALLMHLTGYAIQQTRLSALAFFVGLYGLTGLIWGPRWMRVSFFPLFLLGFCLPLDAISTPVSFPLRVMATTITGWINHGALGINVICDGTRILDPQGTYQYEVAAACSGIRSLTATVLMAVIYGFVVFPGWGKRCLVIASAFPLAVGANVVRLTMIIIASEAFGQEAGKQVHSSTWWSLLPYVPSMAGVWLVGHWVAKIPTGGPRSYGGPEPAGAEVA